MDTGAAILNFGDEFGTNSVEKTMSNDGPNLRENNLPNKVTPFPKRAEPMGADQTEVMGGSTTTPGYSATKEYGSSDTTNDAN